jgi:hypothetical protein
MNLKTIRRNKASKAGVWWEYQTGQRVDAPNGQFCVRVAERDNPQHRATLARLQLANAEKLRAGGEDAATAWSKLVTRALAESILVGWDGLQDDAGAAIPYSVDKAVELLEDEELWPLRHFIEDTAGIIRSYRVEQEEAAKGN